jgi:hypothetical protein
MNINKKSIRYNVAKYLPVVLVLCSLVLSGVLLSNTYSYTPVISVSYTNPKLLSTSMISQEGLDMVSVDVYSGSIPSVLYSYAEFCVGSDIGLGRLTNSLTTTEDPAIIVSLVTRTISLGTGCYRGSFPVELPKGIPAGSYVMSSHISGGHGAFGAYRIDFISVPVLIK